MVDPSSVVLYIQPRASRTEIVGRHGEAIKLRVRAAPVDGAANAEVVRFLAKHLHVSQGAVRIVAGETRRHKRIVVTGFDGPTLTRALLSR